MLGADPRSWGTHCSHPLEQPVYFLASPSRKNKNKIYYFLSIYSNKKRVYTKNATPHTRESISPLQVCSEGLIPGSVRKKIFKKLMEAEAANGAVGDWAENQEGRGEGKGYIWESIFTTAAKTSCCCLSY